MDFYQRAQELKEETLADRRYLHTHAEDGLELPQTKAYVMERLRAYGLEPKDCGHGVTATLGGGQGGYGCAAHAGGERGAFRLPHRGGRPRLRP